MVKKTRLAAMLALIMGLEPMCGGMPNVVQTKSILMSRVVFVNIHFLWKVIKYTLLKVYLAVMVIWPPRNALDRSRPCGQANNSGPGTHCFQQATEPLGCSLYDVQHVYFRKGKRPGRHKRAIAFGFWMAINLRSMEESGAQLVAVRFPLAGSFSAPPATSMTRMTLSRAPIPVLTS